MHHLFGGKWFRKFHFACRIFSQSIGLPDFLTPEIFNLWYRNMFEYDLYHFHDISRTFSPIALRWLAKRKPVVWTFRDCSPFTGGCLYPMECKAFHTKCGNCPHLLKWPLQTLIDLTGIMHTYKKNTALKGFFVPVTASQWTANEAMKSGMLREKPHVIPNYVDTEVFHPHVQSEARSILGLPNKSFIVIVSAPYLRDERKGIRYALEALKSCNRPGFFVLIGRTRSKSFVNLFENLQMRVTGYIRESHLLALYYAAANVFLFTSLGETFGNALIEAMASQTPPISFCSGAIPELVKHQVNGWLSDPKDISG
jgi:glycosyltransferase involved in cell wall biosynthesis